MIYKWGYLSFFLSYYAKTNLNKDHVFDFLIAQTQFLCYQISNYEKYKLLQLFSDDTRQMPYCPAKMKSKQH